MTILICKVIIKSNVHKNFMAEKLFKTEDIYGVSKLDDFFSWFWRPHKISLKYVFFYAIEDDY